MRRPEPRPVATRIIPVGGDRTGRARKRRTHRSALRGADDERIPTGAAAAGRPRHRALPDVAGPAPRRTRPNAREAASAAGKAKRGSMTAPRCRIRREPHGPGWRLRRALGQATGVGERSVSPTDRLVASRGPLAQRMIEAGDDDAPEHQRREHAEQIPSAGCHAPISASAGARGGASVAGDVEDGRERATFRLS